MARCDHASCGDVDKVWLEYEFDGRRRGLKPHPYCVHCGVIKNISTDRARPLGYYTNRLARMPITKVQMRLIIKDLERMAFDDTYFMTGRDQERIFNRVVKKYCIFERGIEQ